jgi:pimeloyl-ACP methyl ester carboxylesterase
MPGVMPHGSAVTSDALPIYLLPGMTSDYPVYSRLTPLLQNARIVDFIDPKINESLTSYARRMAEQFPPLCYIAGVSFGGILALEISRIVQPAGCILIASVTGPDELPPWFRVWRRLGGRNCSSILNIIGNAAAIVPKSIRTSSTIRATKLSGVAGAWHRWATSAVLDWNPDPLPISSPLLHIHGDADSTFPIRYTKPNVVVANGRHSLPISHPVETANAIHAFTRTA